MEIPASHTNMPTPAFETCQFSSSSFFFFYSGKHLNVLFGHVLALFLFFHQPFNPLTHCHFRLTVYHLKVHRDKWSYPQRSILWSFFPFFFIWRFVSMVFKTLKIFGIIRTWELRNLLIFFFFWRIIRPIIALCYENQKKKKKNKFVQIWLLKL